MLPDTRSDRSQDMDVWAQVVNPAYDFLEGRFALGDVFRVGHKDGQAILAIPYPAVRMEKLRSLGVAYRTEAPKVAASGVSNLFPPHLQMPATFSDPLPPRGRSLLRKKGNQDALHSSGDPVNDQPQGTEAPPQD